MRLLLSLAFLALAASPALATNCVRVAVVPQVAVVQTFGFQAVAVQAVAVQQVVAFRVQTFAVRNRCGGVVVQQLNVRRSRVQSFPRFRNAIRSLGGR